MQTHQYQLTLYMPDDAAQPAVALRKPDRSRVKVLSIREAAIQYLGEPPAGEKPVTRLVHYEAGALATDELLACVLEAEQPARPCSTCWAIPAATHMRCGRWLPCARSTQPCGYRPP